MRRALPLGGLLLAGCLGGRVPVVGEAPPEAKDSGAEKAYREVFERYSAKAEIYDGFDTRLFAATTYQSIPFREARARRSAGFRSEPPELLEKRLEEERAEHAKGPEFLLAVHVNNGRYDDFDRRNSIWRISLVTPQGEVGATEVQRIGRSSLDLRALYRYLDDFWVAYRVRFPATFALDQEPRVTLRLASSLGRADLVVGSGR